MRVYSLCCAMVTLLLAVCGCATTAFDKRVKKNKALWLQLSDTQKDQLRAGSFGVGMPAAAAYIARGRPVRSWRATHEGASCRGKAYKRKHKRSKVRGVVAFSCGGVITRVVSMKLTPRRKARMAVIARGAKHLGKLSPALQLRMIRGRYKIGDTAEHFVVAVGPREFSWSSRIDQVSCSIHLYRAAGRGRYINRAVTVCDGRVKRILKLGKKDRIPRSELRRRKKRIRAAGKEFSRLDHEMQWDIVQGDLRRGQPGWVYDAVRPRPALKWQATVGNQTCTIRWYGFGRRPKYVEQEVQECDGVIHNFRKLKRRISVAAFKRRVKRVRAGWDHFSQLSLRKQRKVLRGTFSRGDHRRTVLMALGKPYRGGVEVNAAGKTRTAIYLDPTGDYYGLTVTFKGDKVTGWKKPAKRELTPAAKRRREHKRLAEMKRIADRQRRDRLAAERARMRADRARAQAARDRARAEEEYYRAQRERERAYSESSSYESTSGAPPTVQRRVIKRRNTRRTLFINGRRYTGGRHLGRPCSLQRPCPSGYVCTMATSKLGQCTQ